MNSSLVSVIIPTYNRAYCVTRAIDSALRQTHANVEVLVIDDGSTDDTRGVIARSYADEPRVRYVHQPNGGVSQARNTGLDLARGDYIALLDSDDAWHPWKLAVQLEVFARLPDVGMVWTDMEAVDPNGRVFESRYLKVMYDAFRWFRNDELFDSEFELHDWMPNLPASVGRARVYAGDIFSQMLMGSLVHTSTVVLRRERWEQVRHFRVDLRYAGEDYDFHLRTCRAGRVAFVDAASMQYQRGMLDRLSRPELRIHVATNFLKTIRPVFEQDRERIRLPRWMRRAVLAEAHGWIGEESLHVGRQGAALVALLHCLWHRPMQPRMWKLLGCALLPNAIGHRVKTWYRDLCGHAAASTLRENQHVSA